MSRIDIGTEPDRIVVSLTVKVFGIFPKRMVLVLTPEDSDALSDIFALASEDARWKGKHPHENRT